jgi:hypothetical protein
MFRFLSALKLCADGFDVTSMNIGKRERGFGMLRPSLI